MIANVRCQNFSFVISTSTEYRCRARTVPVWSICFVLEALNNLCFG
ncbi:hypothetical protein BN2497_5581 [Janthinobacterium sp. CG23_2]|nr:hypothetical protein BN2497_5581 [Janthinobacterium sp. CG23_2]CUU29188.1 hypothetical protein BN3177_5581 [Janthinobacterium sp. CG23_2]